MNKILAAVFLIGFSAIGVYALEVDVDEIKTAHKIKFINYRGKARKTETPRQIRAIGRGLARQVRIKGNNIPVRFYLKYSVIHAVSRKEPDKLSADIFSIDRRARVSHIKNVRRILAGFLEDSYEYTVRDAWTLAVFITYYNAIYRGDINYFSSRYKRVVMKKITGANAGISTKYYDWPGKTRILIPLTEEPKRGKIGSIDADLISDEKVRKTMRKDDKLLKERKELVKIKKKIIVEDKEELVKDKEKLKSEREQSEREKKRLEEEKRRLEEKKLRQEKERKRLEEEKKKFEQLKDSPEKRKRERELAEKEKQLKKEKEKIKETEKKLTGEEDKQKGDEERLKEKEKDISEKEKKIDKKEDRVKKEQKEIEEDEKKRDSKLKKDELLAKKEKALEEKEKQLDTREDRLRDQQPDKSIYALKLYYLKIKEYLEGGHYNNELYMINAATRKVDFKSPVENICGSRYDIFSGGIVVITHRGSHISGHRLTMVDRKTLKAVINGKDDIFWRSFVEIRDGFIYVITFKNKQYYLGKYNEKLELVAVSRDRVAKDTFISFFQDYIYINRWDRKILILKKSDLSLVDIIDPDTIGK